MRVGVNGCYENSPPRRVEAAQAGNREDRPRLSAGLAIEIVSVFETSRFRHTRTSRGAAQLHRFIARGRVTGKVTEKNRRKN